MEKLKAAHLFRDELIPISGKLVERYNQCLITLGITETKLSSFSIDGIGWSPEIAEEKINDITRDCAICIDFDQYIDAFYEPLDVLKYKDIAIQFRLINNLDKEQKKQFELIDRFKQGHNFIDEHLQQQLLNSAKTFGDLRHRNLELNELYFPTDSFFTEAFGGVYVLRDFITPIVVFKDEKWHKQAIKDTSHEVLIYHISQPELLHKLRDHLIVEYDLEKVVKTPRYERIKRFMFSQLLKDTQNPINDILNDKVLFKGYLNRMAIEDRKKVMSVELYLEKIQVSNQHKLADIVDLKLFESLQQPHSSLNAKHQDLIWKLLVNISPLDVLFLYWYDKEQFFKNYKNWDESLKEWVIETIGNNI